MELTSKLTTKIIHTIFGIIKRKERKLILFILLGFLLFVQMVLAIHRERMRMTHHAYWGSEEKNVGHP